MNETPQPLPNNRKKSVNRSGRLLLLAMLVVLVAAVSYAAGGRHNSSQTRSLTSGGAVSSVASEQRQALQNQGELISTIAKNVGVSVVSVEVTSQSSYSGGLFGIMPMEQQGAGTGIILNKDGLIITNRHVVEGDAAQVSVTLSDGTKFEDVEIVGRTNGSDPLDIAFLKIKDRKGKDLTPAAIGDSSKVQVGDTVVAIGNALGQFQNTVTSGIISGYGRQIRASDGTSGRSSNLDNLFQTDAAINSGNSGGPLVNLNGEVIGINTAVAGSAQNIGFAIPINDVAGLIRSVTEKGKLERPYLGVVFVPVTADVAKYYDLKASNGAYVPPADVIGREPVVKNGPADKAGLKAGDIITKVNDQTVDAQHGLTSILGAHQPGEKVKLTIVRGDKTQTLDVTLGSAPSE